MKPKNIDALTSLRGIAALCVFFGHSISLFNPTVGSIFNLLSISVPFMGMSLFFILSGFVIHYNYASSIYTQKEKGVFLFLVARFARLYPLYLVFLIVTYCFSLFYYPIVNEKETLSLLSFIFPSYLLGSQSWWFALFHGEPLISTLLSPTWSISSELFLYFTYIPLAYFICFKGTMRNGYLLLFIGLIGRISLYIVCNALELEYVSGSSPLGAYFQKWLIYVSPYGRFFEFLMGMGLAELWKAVPTSPSFKEKIYVVGYCILISALTLFILIDFIELHLLPASIEAITVTVSLICMPIVWIFCRYNIKGFTTFLSSKTMIWFGEISYSLYLWHGLIFAFFALLITKEIIPSLIGWLVAVLCSVGASYLSYKTIEVPARRKLRTLFHRVIE